MSEDLVLHIGTHKTGTTALQGALAASESALEAAGFLYPLMPEKWPHIKQNRNAYWLSMAALQELGSDKVNHPSKIPACLACFTQAVAASNKTLVLSDERMWYCGATTKGYWKVVRALVERAGIKSTRIVIYLRRQDLFAESLWAQYVKGNTRLQQDLDVFLAKKKTVAICDYAAGIKQLQSVFGAENIVVRIYDRSQLIGGDTVTDFLDLLGISDETGIVRPAASSNDSLSPSVTALKLALNRMPQYKEAASNFLLPVLLNVSREDNVKRGSFMSPQTRAEFLARFDEGNVQIAHDFFGRDALFAVEEEELAKEAFQPDAQKLAEQAAQVIVIALQCEEEKYAAETAKLKARIEELERYEKSSLGSKAKRFLKRVARRLGTTSSKESSTR